MISALTVQNDDDLVSGVVEISELIKNVYEEISKLNIGPRSLHNPKSIAMGVIQRGIDYLESQTGFENISLGVYTSDRLLRCFDKDDIEELTTKVSSHLFSKILDISNSTFLKYPWMLNHYTESVIIVYLDKRDIYEKHSIA